MTRKRSERGLFGKLNIFKNLKRETSHGVFAVIFFVIAAFLFLAAIKQAGVVGQTSYSLLSYLMGVGYFLFPVLLIILGISFLKQRDNSVALSQAVGAIIFFFAGLGLIGTIRSGQGGVIGTLVSAPLIKFFDIKVAFIILVGFLVIAFLLIFDSALKLHLLFAPLLKIFSRKKKDGNDIEVKVSGETIIDGKYERDDGEDSEEVSDAKATQEKTRSVFSVAATPALRERLAKFKGASFRSSLKPYTPPPLELLELDRGKPGVGDIKANSNIIKRTLQNFGIDVEMDEVSIGPSVTRYALKPAEGMKLSRIVALQNDLALALAAHPIRIEAPIPGKSLVGIEIPNTIKTTVGLGTLLSSEEFTGSEKALLIALGKGISGRSHFGNLARMPHLLIAGTTGSGKSVSIHAIITSLLYRNSPEHLKFIMIDPKRVELTLYNRIPHLLTPVITDPKKTILALKWAAREMDRRFDILEKERVRDIESYHKNILEPALAKLSKQGGKPAADDEMPETMPYILVIIDELADIMSLYPRELEAAVVRLAQMSRAVGVHLILSTQRPSVNVITGIIKANIPSRIAFQVISQVDSRTILDSSGAEKLLGAGDMLYLSGDMGKPQRLQSAFISESEVKNVVKFLKDSYKDEIINEIDVAAEAKNASPDALFDSLYGDEPDDTLYEEAREIVLKAGKASTSYLQRKLRIGYARAARLIDMLEERGVVGSGSGAKPRDVMGAEGYGSGSVGVRSGNENALGASENEIAEENEIGENSELAPEIKEFEEEEEETGQI